jgi:hypothetical protein
MLVACRLAGLCALEDYAGASTPARNTEHAGLQSYLLGHDTRAVSGVRSWKPAKAPFPTRLRAEGGSQAA